MPVPKGKQRRKPRNRVRRGPVEEVTSPAPAPAGRQRAGRGIARARRQPPLWLNVTLGIIMVVAGTYFTLFSPGGLSIPARVGLLVGYLAVGGYYFFKAYRQYRERASSA